MHAPIGSFPIWYIEIAVLFGQGSKALAKILQIRLVQPDSAA